MYDKKFGTGKKQENTFLHKNFFNFEFTLHCICLTLHDMRAWFLKFYHINLLRRIVISATFGSMIAGQALSFTPDYLSAKVAAGRLFKLFDTKSTIDVNDTSGITKVCFENYL